MLRAIRDSLSKFANRKDTPEYKMNDFTDNYARFMHQELVVSIINALGGWDAFTANAERIERNVDCPASPMSEADTLNLFNANKAKFKLFIDVYLDISVDSEASWLILSPATDDSIEIRAVNLRSAFEIGLKENKSEQKIKEDHQFTLDQWERYNLQSLSYPYGYTDKDREHINYGGTIADWIVSLAIGSLTRDLILYRIVN